MSKNLSKNAIKRHNKLMDIKKELTPIILATSFLYQYEENNKQYHSVQGLIYDCQKVARTYSTYLDDILKVAENEMHLVEQIQRNTKSSRFKKVCKFDEENHLVVSAVGLALNLLIIHSEMQNKKFHVPTLKNYTDVGFKDKEEAKNARIVASRFIERIDKHYDDRKINGSK
jgi:hypothetical protein